jgi:hypothetical protein
LRDRKNARPSGHQRRLAHLLGGRSKLGRPSPAHQSEDRGRFLENPMRRLQFAAARLAGPYRPKDIGGPAFSFATGENCSLSPEWVATPPQPMPSIIWFRSLKAEYFRQGEIRLPQFDVMQSQG